MVLEFRERLEGISGHSKDPGRGAQSGTRGYPQGITRELLGRC